MAEYKEAADVKEVTTIKLTAEQRASIEKASGVSLKEISVLKHSGDAVRQLNASLLQAVSVVACW